MNKNIFIGDKREMPKVIEYHKNNSLIFAIFNKLPTSTQRKIWDIILYSGKQTLFLLKKENPEKYSRLKDSNFKNFFLPITIELKHLMSLLNIESKNKQIQLIKNISSLEEIYIEKINILKGGKEIEINFDLKEMEKLKENETGTGDSYEALLEKFWKIKNKISKYSKHRLIIEPEIDFEEDVLICFLSPNIVKYIESNDNYTVINLLVHTFLNSTYAINLYDILVSKFKAQKEMMDKGKIPKTDLIKTEYIELTKLQDMLGMKKDHSWRTFKEFRRKLLMPSIKEINESNVTEFEIVDVLRKTKKRKVIALSFVLKPKKIFNIPALLNEQIILTNEEELIKLKNIISNSTKEKDNQKLQKNPLNLLEELKQKLKTAKIKSLREFSNELQKLKNIDITNALPNLKGKLLRINEFGMLELNGDEVDNIKANSIRRILYKNPDLLGKIEEIDEELEFLKDKFLNKVWVFMQNNFYYAIGIKELIRENKNKIKVIGEEILRDIKNFEIKVSTDFLKNQRPKEKLELIDKDFYIEHNKQVELEELEKLFKANKDKFQEWLNELEEKSFELNDNLLALEENSDEYIRVAKELEMLDRYYVKGYDLLQGETINSIDKMQILKKFKEWGEEKGKF